MKRIVKFNAAIRLQFITIGTYLYIKVINMRSLFLRSLPWKALF